MKKLQILEKEIRKALPRLMQLREGCKFIYKDKNNQVFKVIYQYELFNKQCFKAICKENYLIDITENPRENEVEIIGHDIMLNDILDFFSGKEIIIFPLESKLVFVDFPREKVYWDLSKLYLKEQSEEFIDFLYNLIFVK